MNENVTVGLFGLGGFFKSKEDVASSWRDHVIPVLEKENISYYNPQGESANNRDAYTRALKHSKEDEIMVYVITSEAYAEEFLTKKDNPFVLRTLNRDQQYVFLIEQTLDKDLTESWCLTERSLQLRKKLVNDLTEKQMSNLHFVEDLDSLPDKIVKLHKALKNNQLT